MPRFVLTLVVIASAISGAATPDQKASPPGHYLFAWTGDADGKGKDFLAVIDADPASPSYGRLVMTLGTDQQTIAA